MGHRSEKKSSTIESRPAKLGVNGFSPVELLMAITLLGIFAATVVPQILSSSETARQHDLLQRLHLVRRRIEQFRDTHDGHLPAEGRNSADDFMHDLADIQRYTTGQNSKRVFSVGSQSRHDGNRIPPVNPYTHVSEILVVPDELKMHHYSGSGQHGWAYSSITGEFRANLSPRTKDQSGRLVNQL